MDVEFFQCVWQTMALVQRGVTRWRGLHETRRGMVPSKSARRRCLNMERLECRLLAAVKIVPAPASYEFVDMGYDSTTQSPVIVGYEHNAPNKTAKIFELNAGQTGFDSTTLPGLAQSTYPTAQVYVVGISSNGQRIAGAS